MPQNVSIRIDVKHQDNASFIKSCIAKELKVNANTIKHYQLIKQSIDARKKPIFFQQQYLVFFQEDQPTNYFHFEPQLQDVSKRKPIHIAGCGPAGLYAALKIIEKGFKPIILERGKSVQDRRRDLAAMNKEGFVNEESNYCFGEGGAGTYSDGKLYTRSGKRGNILECLQWFHYFGADENILYKAHPHIGTNKLPKIIENMRNAIIECGGEVRFDTKLTDIIISNNQINKIELNHNITEDCEQLILATGHSARDIFRLLDRKGIIIESKPFALGVRIEHPQELINEIQYKCGPNDPMLNILGAASYSIVTQENERGVFSFCMCPGGIIAPASTEPGALVVNGWSPSKRNGQFANSGMVVTVDDRDFSKYGFTGNLAAMEYQQSVEEAAWECGGGNLVAPAQRMTDFINGIESKTLPDCSYLPGVTSVPLDVVLPPEVYEALRRGFFTFGSKLNGYLTSEAIITATESRTSSPVKIPRDNDTLEHVQIKGLYPCGEGAGYAGGIISAAMDGMRVAEMAVSKL